LFASFGHEFFRGKLKVESGKKSSRAFSRINQMIRLHRDFHLRGPDVSWAFNIFMLHILNIGAAGFPAALPPINFLPRVNPTRATIPFHPGRRVNLAHALASPHFTRHELDVAALGARAAFVAATKPNAIIHFPAFVSVHGTMTDPDHNDSLNIHTTHLVVETALNAGGRRIIFTSSAAVYGDTTDLSIRETTDKLPSVPTAPPSSPPGQSCSATPPSFRIRIHYLRCFNIFGPRHDPASPYSGVNSMFVRR
jgi:UDP-glucose 4-epimerase